MPVPVMQPIPSPTPIKPSAKRGFSIDELVGTNAITASPKFENLSPSMVVKPEASFSYPFLTSRGEVGLILDSLIPSHHYSQMFNSLPPELRNLDCFGLPYPPRVQVPPALSLIGRDVHPVHPWYTNRQPRYYHPRLPGKCRFFSF